MIFLFYEFKDYLELNNNKPQLIWKIKCDNIYNEIYEEKNINFDGLEILSISYYNDKKDIFNLGIQILNVDNNLLEENNDNNSNDNNNNNDYYEKKDYDLSNNNKA